MLLQRSEIYSENENLVVMDISNNFIAFRYLPDYN